MHHLCFGNPHLLFNVYVAKVDVVEADKDGHCIAFKNICDVVACCEQDKDFFV